MVPKIIIMSFVLLANVTYATEFGLEIDPDGIDLSQDSQSFKKISTYDSNRLDRYFLKLRKTVNKILSEISEIENADEKNDRLEELNDICNTVSEDIEAGILQPKKHTPTKVKDNIESAKPCLSFLQIFGSANN